MRVDERPTVEASASSVGQSQVKQLAVVFRAYTIEALVFSRCIDKTTSSLTSSINDLVKRRIKVNATTAMTTII